MRRRKTAYGARVSEQSPSGAAAPDGVGIELPLDAVYGAVGGEPFFFDLVERFYAGVAGDQLLRPSYPDDLTDSKRWLALFLIQYWGGPVTYSESRGHPRLRMRHFPFVIGMAERDAWLGHMLAAVDAVVAPAAAKDLFRQYFERASVAMINQA
jgi:hemoglobin